MSLPMFLREHAACFDHHNNAVYSNCPRSSSTGLLMLVLDTVLYALLGAYLQAVLPAEFGVPR